MMDMPTLNTGSDRFPEGSTCTCPKCKYLLQGLPLNGVCPECGEQYRQEDTWVPRRRRSVGLPLIGMALLCVPAVWGLRFGLLFSLIFNPALALFIFCTFRTARNALEESRHDPRQTMAERGAIQVLDIAQLFALAVAVLNILVWVGLVLFFRGGAGRLLF